MKMEGGKNEPLVYIDGKFYPKSEAKISVYDHGFLYGDGVFEGIRIYDSLIFKLKEHVDRLYMSAQLLRLKIPISKEELIDKIRETARRNKLENGYIRLVVTRGIGDLGLDPRKCSNPSVIIIAEPFITIVDKEIREKGVRIMISWIRRDSVDATTHEAKTLNYLNSILAKIDANVSGYDEAIILDRNGFICEGSAENLFMVKNKEIYTPPSTTGILNGITRQTVFSLAKKLGYVVEERNITPFELLNADEVFLTGTAAEIIPVREINGRVIGEGKPGPVTRHLMEEFVKLTRDPKNGVRI